MCGLYSTSKAIPEEGNHPAKELQLVLGCEASCEVYSQEGPAFRLLGLSCSISNRCIADDGCRFFDDSFEACETCPKTCFKSNLVFLMHYHGFTKEEMVILLKEELLQVSRIIS